MSIESEGHAAFDSQVGALNDPEIPESSRSITGDVLAILAGAAVGCVLVALLGWLQ